MGSVSPDVMLEHNAPDQALLRPSREQAEEAVRTLIAYFGEQPSREGLVDTPKRVVNAYRYFFSGYAIEPTDFLKKTFASSGYQDFISLKDIPFVSFCEHHLLPFEGKVHLAYCPSGDRVVGLSKLARVVDALAKRMQVQERLTVEIADTLYKGLNAKGVAVMIESTHQCMSHRGVCKTNVLTATTHFLGSFKTDCSLKDRWMQLI